MAVIIEPPPGHRLRKRKFVGGRWVTSKKLVRSRVKLRRVRKRVIDGVVVKDFVRISKPRKLAECEKAVVVSGDVSAAVVERMRLAGVTVTVKGR